jgi:4-hydroxybenzoate polyprenyltransferase
MKAFDYIFLLRPMLIIPVWTISLLGARAALWRQRGISPFILDHFPFKPFTSNDLGLLAMLALATLLAGGIFVLNQIFDVKSDRQNKKLFLMADGHVSKHEAWIIYWLTTGVAIIGAGALNWRLGILFVAGALVGFQYSHPRFKVRADAYKSMRNNMLGHGMLAFLFGWVMYQNFNIEGVLKSVPYLLAVGAIYLNTTLPDIKGDKATGKLTYGVAWGVPKCQSISLFLIFASLVLSVMAADYSLTISAAIALPFAVAAKARRSVEYSVLTTKVAVLALSLFAALFFPVYLSILMVVITCTRVYYQKRFAMAYPELWERAG